MVYISDVLLLQGSDIDVLNDPQKLLLWGLVHVGAQQVQFCIQGELVPDEGLFDAGGVWQYGRRQTEVGGGS